MVQLGTPMPSFTLPDGAGIAHASDALQGPAGTLVIFMCNHCPFVVHVAAELGRLGAEWTERGMGVVGINSNDAATYPEDDPSHMPAFAETYGLTFPYLFDASQDVARAFDATCTPDFFLYGPSGTLVYRGQLDASRPGDGSPVTGNDLRKALEAVSEGRPPAGQQSPSIGCNIKWKSCGPCCGDAS
jgi:peroxiredoxin